MQAPQRACIRVWINAFPMDEYQISAGYPARPSMRFRLVSGHDFSHADKAYQIKVGL
jgi:hypothetical protein